MSNRDFLDELFRHLSDVSQTAIDNMSEAVHSASQAFGDKYDVVKLNIELSRLRAEQERLFENIGRTLFYVQFSTKSPQGPDTGNAQETVDELLSFAANKQHEIDDSLAALSKLTGNQTCPKCGKVCDNQDAFCSACGCILNDNS